ncbi:MAG: adenylosuccinate lyase [Chlorobi bacterium]|nr:adenylosuccinate lyase [Chlorobiota bacterium]
MENNPLFAISPVDGRYHHITKPLILYFSESALIRYRLTVEVEYFIALTEIPLKELSAFPKDKVTLLRSWVENFSAGDASRMKEIERQTNHDVKAVEYFLKEKFEENGLGSFGEFIHFGLTSQDINNTAFPMMARDAFNDIYLPALTGLINRLHTFAKEWHGIPMLARTHGQPASPTLLGKEILVFKERLESQKKYFEGIPWAAKFGGATGNFNAHYAAYPDIDWIDFANHFVNNRLKLHRTPVTTQIEPYDHLAAWMHAQIRINTILIDLSRDFWTYISMEYFKQRIRPGETGSSTMPHKVNPIDFENAEGNLGISNTLLNHMSGKLPVSRLQRDLTDSTVIRNIGMPLAYSLIAFTSLSKGLDKIILNEEKITQDLDNNWSVVAEAIQTILRREGYPKPYEVLKNLTRTNMPVTRDTITGFIDDLDLPEKVKDELRSFTPHNYTGKSPFSGQ